MQKAVTHCVLTISVKCVCPKRLTHDMQRHQCSAGSACMWFNHHMHGKKLLPPTWFWNCRSFRWRDSGCPQHPGSQCHTQRPWSSWSHQQWRSSHSRGQTRYWKRSEDTVKDCERAHWDYTERDVCRVFYSEHTLLYCLFKKKKK